MIKIIGKATFRALAAEGHIPFAIGGILESSKYTKVPKLPFYNWVLQAMGARWMPGWATE